MHQIIIQNATDGPGLVPKPGLLKKWAKAALSIQENEYEVTIRIVGETEISALNSQFRQKRGPTNVLSFPFDIPTGVDLALPILGDIVICAPVVYQEAQTQGKTIPAHFAHLVVHGIFHLLGYDHIDDKQAAHMESLEIETLKTLGFPNPYEIKEDKKTHD